MAEADITLHRTIMLWLHRQRHGTPQTMISTAHGQLHLQHTLPQRHTAAAHLPIHPEAALHRREVPVLEEAVAYATGWENAGHATAKAHILTVSTARQTNVPTAPTDFARHVEGQEGNKEKNNISTH